MSDYGLERFKRCFPDYFPVDKLPSCARQETIAVYRLCNSGLCIEEDFASTYEESLTRHNLKRIERDKEKIDFYSVSCSEKMESLCKLKVIRMMEFPNCKFAKGQTEKTCGLVARSREQDPVGHNKSTHVNWWKFKYATNLHDYFEVIE